MKNYTVDLGSFNVEAEDEEEATQKAVEMIDEGGWVKIDQIIEEFK